MHNRAGRTRSPPSLYSNGGRGARARAACVWRGRARSGLPRPPRRGSRAPPPGRALGMGFGGSLCDEPSHLPPAPIPWELGSGGAVERPKGRLHSVRGGRRGGGEVEASPESHRVTWEGVSQALIERAQARERGA